MKVVVCGSRDGWNWRIRGAIYDRLHELPRASCVMHGGARGVDRLADEFARKLGFFVEEYPADWEQYGKRAGIMRNLKMLDQNPELVIAYWNGESRGTKHMIDAAREREIPVEIHQEDVSA